MDMRVIAGKPYRRTPVFSDRVTYLVMNPSWEVPNKIAKKDLLNSQNISCATIQLGHLKKSDPA